VAAAVTIVERLRQSAERHGARPAIKASAECISYAELFARARRVAGFLRAQGLCAGARVALILPNCIEYVVAYYGVLMAGGVAVPLNAAAKSRDYHAWLTHCEPDWLFAQAGREVSEVLGRLPRPPRAVWVGEGAASATTYQDVLEHDAAQVLPDLNVHQPASIIYTSGTTGRPKGVVLSHGNLASNTAAIVEYLRLTEHDSIVTVLPFYYSYGNSVLHSHLQAGGQVILEQNFVYPHMVVESLARERATGFAGVPSTYALLMGRVKLGDYDLSGLRYVTQAGGAMPPSLTARLQRALPHVDIIVMYGQTEATARLTWLPAQRLSEKMGSVGIPIPGVRIEVRNEAGAPADVGEVGEVWAQGPNVMLGYWRDPQASAAVLRDGWLRTGDMGHLDHDGYLYLVGRRSDMIKVGAHRIHPQDIEEAIAELDGVQEVAVVGVEDELLGQSIKAFVVPAAGAELDAMRVQRHCRERLAAYKVPKQVEIVASLPKTASGKVRRAELTTEVRQ